MTISKTRLYTIYSGMKSRCYNPKDQHYKWYGAKNIKICDDWINENGVQNFIEWALNNGYNDTLTIDRKNSDLDYSPENCRWITHSQNSSFAHRKEFSTNHKSRLSMGEKIKIILIKRGNISEAELARKLGVSPQNLNNKMKRDNFTEKDLIEIATALDCTFSVNFTLNDTGEVV